MDDRELAERLTRAGARLTVPEDLRQLVRGVRAAPAGRDSDAWMDLVAPERDADLTALLRRIHDTCASAGAPGPAPADRLRLLRDHLAESGLAGFLVPRADEYLGEWVPAGAERLAWLTGFTGSAGLAVVLAGRAALFVDGRYLLQAADQVDEELWEVRHITRQRPRDWVAGHLAVGGVLGYDPRLHTVGDVERMRMACRRAGATMTACADNPIDAIWTDRPPAPIAPVRIHSLEHAGRGVADKLDEVCANLTAGGEGQADGAVITAPESVCWLFNVRGGDVPHAPLALSAAILHRDGRADWFIDRHKLAPGVVESLPERVTVHWAGAFAAALDDLGAGRTTVRLDPATTNAWVYERLVAAGARVVSGADPCILPKACKNPVEVAGARAAHRRDGRALVRFLAWLDQAGAGVTESAAAARLEAFRAEDPAFRGPSFETIAGAGPNGAIVHYRVTPATDRTLAEGDLFLVDSGGQYPDGTTDVTRTVAIGTPTPEMRTTFTRVLQGHIAVATAAFPEGTTGSQLDSFAREPLWRMGLDYDHGTGHGVGSFLNVHEGPQRISRVPNGVELHPGMILSNEPGYYRTGAYGIRVESLVVVAEQPAPPGAEHKVLGFETLTLAPIDRRLIDPDLLSAEQIAWLDAYHTRVRDTLTPDLDPATAAWLLEATRPLGAE